MNRIEHWEFADYDDQDQLVESVNANPPHRTPVSRASEPKEFRIALIGCGRITWNHIEAIDRIDGLQVADACDSVESLARETGVRWGVSYFTSIDSMFSGPESEVAVVATRSGLHWSIRLFQANAGRHGL